MAKHRKNKNHPAGQENLLEGPLVAMNREVNVIDGSEGWWIDIGPMRHVCHDLSLFKTYNKIKDKRFC